MNIAIIAHVNRSLNRRKPKIRDALSSKNGKRRISVQQAGDTPALHHFRPGEKGDKSDFIGTWPRCRGMTEGTGAGFSSYSAIVSIRWIASLERASCSAWRSSVKGLSYLVGEISRGIARGSTALAIDRGKLGLEKPYGSLDASCCFLQLESCAAATQQTAPD